MPGVFVLWLSGKLEKAAQNGDTLRAQANIITELRRKESLNNEERTEVTADLLTVAEEEQFPVRLTCWRWQTDEKPTNWTG